MKKLVISLMLVLSLTCVGGISSAYAVTGSIDEIVEDGNNSSSIQNFMNNNSNNSSSNSQTSNNSNTTNSNTTNSNTTNSGTGDADRDSVTDALRDYKPITKENMATAQRIASPVQSFVGNIVGTILLLVSAGIVFTTGIDMLVIGVPLTRSILIRQPVQGQQGQQGGGFQLISDEAMACMGMSGGQQGTQGGMSGGMGGYGGSMGGMGGYGGSMGGYGGSMGGMNGMNGMGGSGQEASTKSMIVSYLKKRTVFLVVFGICLVILTSSVLFNCGVNIAQLLFKVMDKINTGILTF